MIETIAALQPINTYQPTQSPHTAEALINRYHTRNKEENQEEYNTRKLPLDKYTIDKCIQGVAAATINAAAEARIKDIISNQFNKKVAQCIIQKRKEENIKLNNQLKDIYTNYLSETVANITERDSGTDIDSSETAQNEHDESAIVRDYITNIRPLGGYNIYSPIRTADTYEVFLKAANDPEIRDSCLRHNIVQVNNDSDNDKILDAIHKKSIVASKSLQLVEMHTDMNSKGQQVKGSHVHIKPIVKTVLVMTKKDLNDMNLDCLNQNNITIGDDALYEDQFKNISSDYEYLPSQVTELHDPLKYRAISINTKISAITPINSDEVFTRCADQNGQEQVLLAFSHYYQEHGDLKQLAYDLLCTVNKSSFSIRPLTGDLVSCEYIQPAGSIVSRSPYDFRNSMEALKLLTQIRNTLHRIDPASIEKVVMMSSKYCSHTDSDRNTKAVINTINKNKCLISNTYNIERPLKINLKRAIKRHVPAAEREEIEKAVDNLNMDSIKKEELYSYVSKLNIDELVKIANEKMDEKGIQHIHYSGKEVLDTTLPQEDFNITPTEEDYSRYQQQDQVETPLFSEQEQTQTQPSTTQTQPSTTKKQNTNVIKQLINAFTAFTKKPSIPTQKPEQSVPPVAAAA